MPNLYIIVKKAAGKPEFPGLTIFDNFGINLLSGL
jgi:hypothetical protein